MINKIEDILLLNTEWEENVKNNLWNYYRLFLYPEYAEDI